MTLRSNPGTSLGYCAVQISFSNPSGVTVSSDVGAVYMMGQPVISYAEPAVAYTGSIITIVGDNFDDQLRTCSAVVCTAVAMACEATSRNQVVITVPGAMQPGLCPVQISFGLVVIGSSSDIVQIAGLPSISTQPASPGAAYAGGTVTVWGSNFAGGACGATLCNTYESPCTVISQYAIQIVIGTRASAGTCGATIQFLNPPNSLLSVTTAGNYIRVLGDPSPSSIQPIVLIDPAVAYRSSIVTISGFVFLIGSSTRACSVYVCGVLAPACTIVSSSTVVATISSSLLVTLGVCSVQVQFNQNSNADQGFAIGTITLLGSPTLSSNPVLPSEAWAGNMVTVVGANFAGGACSATVCGQSVVSCVIMSSNYVRLQLGELFSNTKCSVRVSILNPFSVLDTQLQINTASLYPSIAYAGSTVTVIGAPITASSGFSNCTVMIASRLLGRCSISSRPNYNVVFSLEGLYASGKFTVRVDLDGDTQSTVLVGSIQVYPSPKI